MSFPQSVWGEGVREVCICVLCRAQTPVTLSSSSLPCVLANKGTCVHPFTLNRHTRTMLQHSPHCVTPTLHSSVTSAPGVCVFPCVCFAARFSKISKVDLRSVFRVDDPMPEPLRAVVWPEHYVASKNAAAAASGGGGAPPLQPAHDAHIPTATFGAAIGGVADVSSASAPIKPEPGVGVGASTRAQLPPPTLIPAAGAAQSDEEMAGTHALPPPPTTHAHTGTHYTAPLDPVAHIPGGMPMVISQATEDAVLSGVGEDSVDASSVAHVPSPSLGMEALAARGIDIPVVVTEPSVSIRDTE